MLAHRLARPVFTRHHVLLARAFATKPPHAPQADSEVARKQAADKIIKEYLDSTKPPGTSSTSPGPGGNTASSNTAPLNTPSNAPSPKADAESKPKPESPTTEPLAESKPAGQSLALWKDATLSLLRSRAQKAGADAAVQFSELGGKLNKVTGYDRIEELKRRVVEREHSIAQLRGAARDAKQAYTSAVATRASRQREVNDLLQRKSTWSDADVSAFTKLVREDHLSAASEAHAKSHLEQTETAVDAEFGALMRAILDRYHEEQVWSDKIRSMSTYGSLAALVVNVVVFVMAIVVVEPWKRKRLAQTFEQRIVEMAEETRGVVESGIRGLEERLDRQEEVLAGLGSKVDREPRPEPKPEPEPAPAPPKVLPPWLNEGPVVDQARAWLAAVTPETNRDYALLALGGLGSLIGEALGNDVNYSIVSHSEYLFAGRRTMHGKDQTDGISISCRFLATDQWLRAHVNPSWTIFELKRHLLAKCVGGVPLAMGEPGPRLLQPSQSGLVTLAGLVQAPYTSAIKTGRPNTAPHDDSRRKPRLSLKVVPGLTKPPRTVTIHPPTPALFGPSMAATGPQPPPSVYFSRNPELSPPVQLEDESSPSSPNTQHDTMSNASRSTVALPYSQPHSHTTSPTYSAGASPPSRPFSPTSLPRAPEPQSLEFSTLLRARSTPPLSRALSSPPSPYSPPLTSRPFPLPTSPPIDSRIDASQISISDTADSITESTNSPLLSAAEFFDLDAQEPQDVLVRSPSPPTGLVSASSGSTVFAARSVMAPVEVETHTRRNWEDAFRIASFSQGCLLEEHSTVADLRIRPGELLEIQRVNAAVHLSRPTYTQPYFEAPVYLIKRTPMHYPRPQTSHHPHPLIPAARPHQHHIQPMRDYAPPIPEINPPMSPIEATTRVRSRTVTARDVYDNVSEKWDDDGEQEWAELELSGLEGIGESNGRARPVNENPVRNEGDKIEWKVRWLTLREGMFSLSRSRSKQAQPLFSRPVSSVLTAQQLPAVPSMGHLPRNYISIHFTGISRKERERERDCDIGIRMMDGAAHAHLFRVLLRIINTPGTHTFLHTDTPYFASPPLPSQYPEWRQYIVQRAWLAGRATSIMHGLTVAGPWMRSPWLAWTDKEAESFPDDDTSQYGDEYETDSDDASQLYESQIGAMEGFDQQRDSDSEVEWDVEGWRAWESENAFGSWTSSAVWLKHRVDAGGRPRSRSLAAPSSRSSSMNQPREPPNSTYPYPSQHPELLSPVSTSSDISTTSPNTRRARSSTIAVPSQPESPTGSPPTWSPTLGQRRPLTSGAGIETVLRTPTASQSRRSELDRRGSTNSLEMQRAHPPSSRRAVTSPPPGAKFP